MILLEIIQAKGSSNVHIHLTPGKIKAIWHLTQAIGKAFWHMTTWAQCVLVGVPSAFGIRWLSRWDPLNDLERNKKK